jgi:hypothetical protein
MLRTFAAAPFAVLLSVFMLLSQQAGLRHELSHVVGPVGAAHAEHDDPDGHHPGELCKDCLAFAQIDGAIHTDVLPPALLCGMRFHAVAAQVLAAQDAACPAQRSRGPPSLV